MLELVGNPQEYVYIMSLSHLEQILEWISRSTHAYRFTSHHICMGHVAACRVHTLDAYICSMDIYRQATTGGSRPEKYFQRGFVA